MILFAVYLPELGRFAGYPEGGATTAPVEDEADAALVPERWMADLLAAMMINRGYRVEVLSGDVDQILGRSYA